MGVKSLFAKGKSPAAKIKAQVRNKRRPASFSMVKVRDYDGTHGRPSPPSRGLTMAECAKDLSDQPAPPAGVLASVFQADEAPGVCSWPHTAVAGVDLTDELIFPLHKSAVVQHREGDGGEVELQLYYGVHVICFDEPETFAFGETLARKAKFTAGEAAGWQPELGWPKVAQMLATLLDKGVLRRASDLDGAQLAVKPGPRPSPLPPAPLETPRAWAECPAIMTELAGRPLELGHLELVVPIFRVAHMAMDAEGRQVGEANVFPKAMRVEVETRWQTCLFEGSRHQSDLPMNVTALKAMRAYWPQMMAVLGQVRHAYLNRFPEARAGWTVGHVERLATVVLALPTWQLMRAVRPVKNGELHAALSCLFRVTDGLRMTMHQMLFVPFGEPTRSPDSPVTAAEIHDYAERNHSFHSEHGVCAGPRAMVEEFLSVILDGKLPAEGLPFGLDSEVVAAVCEIEPALDYGLLGLKAYAATFSLWPAMTRAYEAIASAVADCAGGDSPRAAALDARFRGHVQNVRLATYIANEEWRVNRETVYADMYAQCVRGLTGSPPSDPLSRRLAPVRSTSADLARRTIGGALEAQFADPDLDDGLIVALAEAIFDFLLRAQAVLRLASEVQGEINDHLGRRQPLRPFTGRDIEIHNILQGVAQRRLPYLLDELEAAFGLAIEVDGQTLTVARIPRLDATQQQNSEGAVPTV